MLVTFAWMPRAVAAPVRILIAAGARTGMDTDRPLLHPQDDAAGVRDVMTSLGGVTPDHLIFLPDTNKAALLAALSLAAAMAREHAPTDVTLIFYFSGHGDRDSLHIRGETLSNAELSARISAIPAALRIVVVDACRTNDARAKGMSVVPGFAVSLASQSATTGTAWFYASADGEAAQESDEIGGAIFTHFWLAGLRGAADTNRDARVSLDESFSYAYSQTLLRSARSGGVLQRPEAKLDLHESNPFIFTELAGARAQLEFPRGSDALYLVYAVGSQSVVAEVYGVTDRNVRIVLPPSRYIIQKRVGTRGEAVELTLRAGAVHSLSVEDFRSFAAEALAQKGSMVTHPWSVEALGDVMAGSEMNLGGELQARIARRERWGFALGPLVGFGERATPFNDVREKLIGGELSVDRFFSLSSAWLIFTGIDVRGEWIWQTVTRTDAARATLAGFQPVTHASGAAWGGGVHVGARCVFAPPFFLDVGLRAMALGTQTTSGVDARVLGGGFLGLGFAL